MPSLPSTRAGRFVYAVKPASWPKLLAPMALGQAIGIHEARRVDGVGVALGVAFTVCLVVFIVLLNDWGDREVDGIKRRMFPDGCSPKTIPDGILPAHQVLTAGLAAGALALAVGWGATLYGRPFAGWAGLGCVGLFVAYTLPPLRLNYRGGGELLEMIGTGVALPWLTAYLASGEPSPRLLPLLEGFSLLCLASAVASGLSDEQSDRRGGKRTVVTMVGNPIARRVVEGLVFLAILRWLVAAVATTDSSLRVGLAIATAGLGGFLARMRTESPRATTNAFTAQARYKSHLHNGTWLAAASVAISLFASTLIGGGA